MNVQNLFAQRIGGENFGRVQQTFKFTLINNAKKAFIDKNPTAKVIDMGVGEPEEIPSEDIIQRLYQEALVKENRIYPCNGTLEFCEAAARYLNRAFSISVDPKKEVMHCIGAKAALAQIPLAFVDPGDSIIATTPAYSVLQRATEWLGGRVHNLPLESRNNFLPDLDLLEQSVKKLRPKMVHLNYPNNPTGGVATRELFERVIELAHRHTFLLVQDAAHADYVFNGEFVSPLQIPGGKEVTLEIYSLSKGYNMQGYRIGFVTGGAPLVQAFSLVKDNTDNGQFIAIQKAGVYALDHCQKFLDSNRAKYSKRMERVVSILEKAGIRSHHAGGTFFLYVAAPKVFRGVEIESAQQMADLLISRYGIVTVPWDDAGAFLRLSMTFEIGNRDFADDEEVFQELERRLVHDQVA